MKKGTKRGQAPLAVKNWTWKRDGYEPTPNWDKLRCWQLWLTLVWRGAELVKIVLITHGEGWPEPIAFVPAEKSLDKAVGIALGIIAGKPVEPKAFDLVAAPKGAVAKLLHERPLVAIDEIGHPRRMREFCVHGEFRFNEATPIFAMRVPGAESIDRVHYIIEQFDIDRRATNGWNSSPRHARKTRKGAAKAAETV